MTKPLRNIAFYFVLATILLICLFAIFQSTKAAADNDGVIKSSKLMTSIMAQDDIWVENPDFDWTPQLNSKGQMTWMAFDGEDWEVLYYNGIETKRLTDNSYNDMYPRIGNNGLITWSRRSMDASSRVIILYDGERQLVIPGSDLHGSYAMNDKGHIIWSKENENELTTSIYLYKGARIKKITEIEYDWFNNPRLNNNGAFVWHGCGDIPGEFGVHLFDGQNQKFLGKGHGQSINNDGWVVWQVKAENTDIMLYDGLITKKLNEGPWGHYPFEALLNDNGMVVWSNETGNAELGIYCYDGTSTTLVLPNTEYPQVLNNRGWFAWVGYDGHDSEIFLYDGTNVIQVTDNEYDDWLPTVNDVDWDPLLYFGVESSISVSSDQSVRAMTGDPIAGDHEKPIDYLTAPFQSTKISKTTRFKVEWPAADPSAMAWRAAQNSKAGVVKAGSSGIKQYTVKYRPSTSSTWKTWKINTKSTSGYFTGKQGVTYYFKATAEDNAGNIGWSGTKRTIVPLDQGVGVYRRVGFNSFSSFGPSNYYMDSVRSSYRAGHTMVYKVHDTYGLGLISTKGPKMGKAKIYVDGKYVKTVNAYDKKRKPRQRLFYHTFKHRGTHYLKIVNVGVPGRRRFDIDAVMAGR